MTQISFLDLQEEKSNENSNIKPEATYKAQVNHGELYILFMNIHLSYSESTLVSPVTAIVTYM